MPAASVVSVQGLWVRGWGCVVGFGARYRRDWVQVLDCRIHALGSLVSSEGCRVQGFGFIVQVQGVGLFSRVQDSGLRQVAAASTFLPCSKSIQEGPCAIVVSLDGAPDQDWSEGRCPQTCSSGSSVDFVY